MAAADEKKSQVQAQFGTHARFYATSPSHARGDSLVRLVQLCQPATTATVLDVATAAGHNAFSFAPHVRYVVGLDLTPEMLPQARRLASERALSNVSFSQGDAERLPFAKACFDVVTCRIAPHHFPNVGLAVSEMARVCRPGGCVAICDNITPEDADTSAYINAFETRRDPSHNWAYALSDWRQFFERAGLGLEAEEILPKRMHFTMWATRLGIPQDVVDILRQELFCAPPSVREFLKPRYEDDDEYFDLTEVLLIGRK